MSKNLFLSFFSSFSPIEKREKEKLSHGKRKEKGSDPWRERRRMLLFLLFFFFSGMQHQGEKKVPLTFLAGRRGRRKQEWTEGLSFKEGRGFIQQCRLDKKSLELFQGNLFFSYDMNLRRRLIIWRDGNSIFY